MTETLHHFILTDLATGEEFMSTQVDAFDPSIDAEFWEVFMGGGCAMIYLGEVSDNELI